MAAASEPRPSSHAVLFYKYVCTAESDDALDRLVVEQRALCTRLGLLGRLLISHGGVNGALCCSGCGEPNDSNCPGIGAFIEAMEAHACFSAIDWKRSSSEPPQHPPFFDELSVRRVNEIVATNRAAVALRPDGSIDAGGRHLSPSDWHAALLAADESTVIVDVRNTFEHAIGRFETCDGVAAIEPGMHSFTEFESWADLAAGSLRDKRVLMFCTGGVRCETASAMLRARGVDDVSQLSGGIHRYIEQYSTSESGGLFRGRNFVFDHRVSTPSCVSTTSKTSAIVGRCVEPSCAAPYDELSGARVCTVCRDFVLVCPRCVQGLRELHCAAHQYLRDCYFTFIDGFTADELDNFALALTTAITTARTSDQAAAAPAAHAVVPQLYRDDSKRIRKHIARLKARAADLRSGSSARNDADWRSLCRSCGTPIEACAAHRTGALTRCAVRQEVCAPRPIYPCKYGPACPVKSTDGSAILRVRACVWHLYDAHANMHVHLCAARASLCSQARVSV